RRARVGASRRTAALRAASSSRRSEPGAEASEAGPSPASRHPPMKTASSSRSEAGSDRSRESGLEPRSLPPVSGASIADPVVDELLVRDPDLDRVGHDAVADPDRRPGWVIQRLADELLGLVPVRDRRASAERSDLPLALTPAPVSLVLLLRHALDAALDASCRRRSHRKTSAARGFAPSSLPFRLSELVQKTKPRSSKCSRTTVRAAGRPSVDAVASTTGSCSSRHHSSNTRIGSACTRYRYPAAKSRCLDVSLEAVEGPIGMI